MLVACDKPDASDVTSPSALALLGTTSVDASYEGGEEPPEPIDTPAEGWEFFLGNVRYSDLENEQASMQIVTRVQSVEGAMMELWLWREGETALYWEAGPTNVYNGVFCFQLRLEDAGEALQLEPEQYFLTIGFMDEASGEYAAVQEIRIAGSVPEMDGGAPGADTRVANELLGCPRSVI